MPLPLRTLIVDPYPALCTWLQIQDVTMRIHKYMENLDRRLDKGGP